MKETDKFYLGSVISLVLLIAGYLVLPFREPEVLPRVFALLWMSMMSLSAVSFIGAVRRREQLAIIRKRWREENKTGLHEFSDEKKFKQRVRARSSDEK